MEIELTQLLIVCPLVFLAGLVDSIAGGGGLIAVPAYLIAGIPPHFALGTNKLSSVLGTAVATFRMWRNRYIDLLFMLPSVATAFAGSATGAGLVLLVDEKYLQYILLAILPITAFYVMRKKNLDTAQANISRKAACIIAAAISFVVGMYDGFYGPGTGTFLILAYTGLAKMNIRNANGNAKLINLTSNFAALVVFMINGKVIFLLGLTAAIFSIAGNYIGAGLVIKKGSVIVRPIILTVLALLFIKILWQ